MLREEIEKPVTCGLECAHSNLQLSSSTSYNQYILQYYSLIYMRILTEAARTYEFTIQRTAYTSGAKVTLASPNFGSFTHKLHLQHSCLMGILCHWQYLIQLSLSSEIFLTLSDPCDEEFVLKSVQIFR